MSIERRRDPRVDVRVPACLRRTSGLTPVEVMDVSVRGLFIRTNLPLAINELLRFEMTLPSGKIDLHAVTVRICPDRFGRIGVGLRLFAMNGHELSSWQAFVAHTLRERTNTRRAA